MEKIRNFLKRDWEKTKQRSPNLAEASRILNKPIEETLVELAPSVKIPVYPGDVYTEENLAAIGHELSFAEKAEYGKQETVLEIMAERGQFKTDDDFERAFETMMLFEQGDASEFTPGAKIRKAAKEVAPTLDKYVLAPSFAFGKVLGLAGIGIGLGALGAHFSPLNPQVGMTAPVGAQDSLTPDQIDYVKKVIDLAIETRGTRFSQALNLKRTGETSLDVCNAPEAGNVTIENVDLGENTQISYDILNRFGLQFESDQVISPEIVRASEQFLERYLNRDISPDNIRPVRNPYDLRTNPQAEFVDVVHRGNLGRTFTSNTPNLGYHREFLYPGEMHVLLPPAVVSGLGTPNAKVVKEYCFPLDAQILVHADLNFMMNGSPNPEVAPVVLPSGSEQTTPDQPPGQTDLTEAPNTIAAPVDLSEAPNTVGTPVAAPENGSETPEATPTRQVPDSVSVLEQGKNSKLRAGAGLFVMPWTEDYDITREDENGVGIVESQSVNMNYIGGDAFVGYNINDWLAVLAHIQASTGNGDHDSTRLQYLIGASAGSKNIGELALAFQGGMSELSLSDNEIELSKKFSPMGVYIGGVTKDLIASPNMALWLWANYSVLQGEEKRDLTIKLSELGLPDINETESFDRTDSVFNAGARAMLLPFANGRGNLGLELGITHKTTDLGNKEGMTLWSVDPRLVAQYAIGPQGKGGLIEFTGGYSPVMIKTDDSSVDPKSAGFGFIELKYRWGARPSPLGPQPY